MTERCQIRLCGLSRFHGHHLHISTILGDIIGAWKHNRCNINSPRALLCESSIIFQSSKMSVISSSVHYWSQKTVATKLHLNFWHVWKARDNGGIFMVDLPSGTTNTSDPSSDWSYHVILFLCVAMRSTNSYNGWCFQTHVYKCTNWTVPIFSVALT